MAIVIDQESNFKGEKVVRNAFEKFCSNQTVIYNNREVNGREYDLCVLYENSCIFIVEVKGWLKDKITVNGVDDIVVEGYLEHQTSPKKQAKGYALEYLNKMKHIYGKSPLIIDLVAYPFISRNEYYEKRLNIISEEQFTLFKEDLQDRNLLNEKLQIAYILKKGIAHEELDRFFVNLIRKNEEPNYTEEQMDREEKTYSILKSFIDPLPQEELKKIENSYFNGTKLFLFLQSEESVNQLISLLNQLFRSKDINPGKDLEMGFKHDLVFDFNRKSMQIFNLELYLVSDICESFEIIDGQIGEHIDHLHLLSNQSSFNLNQYRIEHANPEHNILVKAGAGTGKTYSMISRISFLSNSAEPAITDFFTDLVMVTFTNDATKNMQDRIKKLFLNYYILTKNVAYLRLVDQVGLARINTIHKFSIDILRGASTYTGLSKNFKIAQDAYLRGNIYDKYLNKFLIEKRDEDENYPARLYLPVYELKKKLMQLTDQFWQKNIDLEQINYAQLGHPVMGLIPDLNEMIMKIIVPSEHEYTSELAKRDQLDLKTAIIKLNTILKENRNKIQLPKVKYIFIDEFQDTDDIQIDMFLRIQTLLDNYCRFFVVGDIKQNIYRFRGAKLDVFDVFKKKSKHTWDSFTLNTNYRSDYRLLQRFEPAFWRMKEMGNLPYNIPDDVLVGYQKLNENDEALKCFTVKQDEFNDAFMNILIGTKMDLERKVRNIYAQGKTISKEKRTIAILVRDNSQAERIAQLGKAKHLLIKTTKGENIFRMPSTLDLYKLVLAMHEPTDLVSLVNFIQSNYCRINCSYYEFSGVSQEEKAMFLRNELNEYFKENIGITWDEILNEANDKPILSLIRKIFVNLQPELKYSEYSNLRNNYFDNFDYLLEMISDFYQGEVISLNKVFKYLSIKIKTNQETPGIPMKQNDDPVEIICTTIHKSKGLEYGIVMLPYTERRLLRNSVNTMVEYGDSKVIYTLDLGDEMYEVNSNYEEFKDQDEQIAEETRVLYVAMTRAINECIWIKTVGEKLTLCWRNMLEEENAD